MKSGASDPFDDASEDDEEDPAADEERADAAAEATPADENAERGDGVEGGRGNDERASVEGGEADSAQGSEGAGTEESGGLDRSQIPYTLRRDNVKDERPHVHQLFVRDGTDDEARDAERELEDLLGTDVYRLDAREAIYRIGMRHPEEVADLLEEWGYNF